jgi:hypothetical protein
MYLGRGGRPALPAQVKSVAAARRSLGRLGDPAAVLALDQKSRDRLRTELEAMRDEAAEWLRRLEGSAD